MNVTLIGIDCATQTRKTGVAVGRWDGTAVTATHVTLGRTNQSIAATIYDLLPQNDPVLIAIDAPLGWPHSLGTRLIQHQAGDFLPLPANQLFRRETDTFIQQTLAKTPLDVGAGRIARTAHSALAILEELRQLTSQPIPLAWRTNDIRSIHAIEVYPAGTLEVLYGRDQVPSYKGKMGSDGRGAILNRLQSYINLPADQTLLFQNDDALDAIICLLSGADFLWENTMPPINIQTAKKEGWIWVRNPGEIDD